MIFGSDYPHAEGLADPKSFVDDLPGFTEDEIRLVMRDNGLALSVPPRLTAVKSASRAQGSASPRRRPRPGCSLGSARERSESVLKGPRSLFTLRTEK